MVIIEQNVLALNRCETIFVAVEKHEQNRLSFEEVIKINIMSQNKTDQIRQDFDFFTIPENEKAELFILASLHQKDQFNDQKIDFIYQLTIKNRYINYLEKFNYLLNQSDFKKPFQIPLLFGIDRVFDHLHIDESNLNPRNIDQYVEFLNNEFNRSSQINLSELNMYLVQMTFISDFLLGRINSEKLAELYASSSIYLGQIDRGQIFIAVDTMWSTQAMLYQWLMNVNVLNIPLKFDNSKIHGGMTAIDGIIHDIYHVYKKRRSFKEFKINATIEEKLFQALIESVHKTDDRIPAKYKFQIFQIAFFILHEKQVFDRFLSLLKAYDKNWGLGSRNVNQMTSMMLSQLSIHHRFFPDIQYQNHQFSKTTAIFISEFAQQSKKFIQR